MIITSIWPIITASVVSFVIGAIWYSPILFGKEWMSLIGMNEQDITEARTKSMISSYLGQFILTVITFIILAFAINMLQLYTARDGAMIALIAWLGFILPGALGGMIWEKKPFKLVLINSIGTLITLIAGGAIIGGWR